MIIRAHFERVAAVISAILSQDRLAKSLLVD